jgi:hypothetical protein
MILVGVCREVADELHSTSYFEQPLSRGTRVSTSRQVASADTGDELDASSTRRTCVGGGGATRRAERDDCHKRVGHVRGTSRLRCHGQHE